MVLTAGCCADWLPTLLLMDNINSEDSLFV